MVVTDRASRPTDYAAEPHVDGSGSRMVVVFQISDTPDLNGFNYGTASK